MFLTRLHWYARATPDRLAVISNGQRVNYRRFVQLVEVARHQLMAMPLPRGGVVAEVAGDLLHKWVLLLALRSLGRTTISGDSWNAITPLGVADITAVITVGGDEVGTPPSTADRPVIVIPRRMFTAPSDDVSAASAIDGRFGDHIVYTSGTTGTNKKLRLEGAMVEQLVNHDLGGSLKRFLGPDEVYHGGSFGPWTIAGYRMSLACWYHGATVIFDQRRDAIDHFFDHGVTMTVMLPPRLAELCARHRDRTAGAGRLRIMTSGGFVSADLALRAVRQFDCDLYVNYAGTEFRTSLESLVGTQEDVVWLARTPNSELEIVDDDDRPVPAGREGIVRVKLAPSDPTEYLDDPVATAQHFQDGYFYPGDAAIMRADGRVRLLGRTADVLNVGGKKLAVAPLEEQARSYLGVNSLCLFAQQTDDGRNVLLCVMEGDALPDLARRDALVAEIGGYFSETRFSLLQAFPRGANGMMKVNRRALLALVS